MKSDIDALMKSRNFSAIVVHGNAEHNPPMYYFTGGGHINNAILIKKINEDPILFCNDMEREEASRSGLEVRCFSEFPLDDYLKKAEGNLILASAYRLKEMFLSMNLEQGSLCLFGQTEFGSTFAIYDQLKTLMPSLHFVGEANENSLLMKAMETKDTEEIDRIRNMGRITTKVVGLTADYLSNCDVDENENLLNETGEPLTIGDVKNKINLWLAESGVENPHGTIFAIGRDAGVPHSTGNPDDVMQLGKTIVFDIFPTEKGGGYHYDFTRTWCLGYAPEEAMILFNQVQAVREKVVDDLDLNAPFKEYQRKTCDLFEADNHPTNRSHKGTVEGYVHNLGHGVGLNIHERPWSNMSSDDDNRLVPGVVFTIEPGLYYPEKGMGVRLEDTFCVREDGTFELVSEYPYDFVIPMKKWEK
ncbi:MAG: M24 family metallopeptidase [Anaerolineales bacterium]